MPATGEIWVPVDRNGFYSHTPNWGAATARNWALLTKGGQAVLARKPGESLDISACYREHLGLSPVDLLAVALGLVAYYNALTRDDFNQHPHRFVIGDRFMDALGNDALKATCRTVLRQLSAPWEEHVAAMKATARGPRENVQQFFSIYDRPLLRDGEVYCLLDLEFVKSQTTEGWYWTLVRALSRAGLNRDIHRLHTAFGHAFEWYCSGIAAALRGHAANLEVWTDWREEIEAPDGQALPDVLIRDGDVLFVVEATAAAVPPATAVSCDPEHLKEALTRVWFGDSPKLRQLAAAREGVLRGRVRAEGLDMTKIARVVPLLVSLRYVPRHLGTWHWYRDIILANGLPEEFAEMVQILDSEDWEEFCAGGLEGRGLAESYYAWQRSPWSRQAFEDWRAATIGKRPIHPIVAAHLDSLWKAMPKELQPQST